MDAETCNGGFVKIAAVRAFALSGLDVLLSGIEIVALKWKDEKGGIGGFGKIHSKVAEIAARREFQTAFGRVRDKLVDVGYGGWGAPLTDGSDKGLGFSRGCYWSAGLGVSDKKNC